MDVSTELSGVILLGGYSVRLGSEKSLVNVHGLEQYKYVYSILKTLIPNVYYSGRLEQQKSLNISEDIFINDVYPDVGPLCGILSSLKKTRQSILVLACDLPFINSALINSLLEKRSNDHTITLFYDHTEKRLQPLCSIWDKSLVPSLEEYLKSGRRSVLDFIKEQKHNLIDSFEEHRFLNINTHVDLLMAQNLVKDDLNLED